MQKSILLLCAFAVFIIAASSGCRSVDKNKSKTGPDTEILNPEPIPNEFPQDPWNPNDPNVTRLTDAETGTFEHVYFKLDAHNIPGSEMAKINRVYEFLNKNDVSVVVIVEGHCDERGTNEYNFVLGENRAINVRNQLIALGISPTRIKTVSFGEEKPVVPLHTESAWSKNRRAEFAFYRLR